MGLSPAESDFDTSRRRTFVVLDMMSAGPDNLGEASSTDDSRNRPYVEGLRGIRIVVDSCSPYRTTVCQIPSKKWV